MPSKRTLVLGLLVAGLALPPAASGRVIELGAGAPAAKPSCPSDPCQAVTRVTGYMGRSGPLRNPFLIRRDGKIVAFTVTLGKPEPQQIEFFNGRFGGPPAVRLSVVRRGKRRKDRLTHRLLAQTRIYRVDRYLGSSPSFALDEPLRVEKGNIVALTVPTWAPALGIGLGRDNWWRSSRRKPPRREGCTSPEAVMERAAQGAIGGLRIYGCTYFTARMLYTATYVTDPRPTS